MGSFLYFSIVPEIPNESYRTDFEIKLLVQTE